jgi:CDP-diacylglycerol--serine O-phosphatidyltransferase
MEFDELDPIGTEEGPRHRFRSRRLQRGVYLLPSACTVANILCGYYAILATLDGRVSDYDNAACAIGFAYIFDSLDGKLARTMGTESSFGKEFDSLADIVSFGLAPAFLAYAWGVRAVAAANAPEAFHLIQLGWLIGFFFVVCCAWRLARFNIHGMAPGDNRFFVGMPTPAAAGMVASVVHFVQNPIQDPRWSLLWLVLLLALGVLMSSSFRYYTPKNVQWTKRQPSVAVVMLALLIGAIVYFSRITLLTITTVYALHGIVLQLVRVVRHRLATRHA